MTAKAFELLKTYTWGDDRKTLNSIDEAIVATQGDSNGRQELEDQMIAVLESDATRNGKDYVCRKLKIIGTAASVPALASMLGNEDHSHMARYALESMPNAEAGKALLDSLNSVTGKLKVGVISSLGVRQDDAAVPALAKLAADDDAMIAQAAVYALGAIRSAAAAKALSEAKVASSAAAADASLACAESLLADGDKSAALMIYKNLTKGSPAKHVKLAATRGMLACAKK